MTPADLERADEPSREQLLTAEALAELKYIAASGRLYAPMAAEMIQKDQEARRALALRGYTALRAKEADDATD
jgi:hypothetical protein